MKKVIYEEYDGRYDADIARVMISAPDNIDVETMRANLYGYTFTEDYARGELPDTFSMDYWADHIATEKLVGMFPDLDASLETDSKEIAEVQNQGKYGFVSPQENLLLETIDSTGDGLSPETALCVIDVSQEYEYISRVIHYATLEMVRQSYCNGIDCLEFEDSAGKVEKLYFDISRRFEVGYKF